MCCGTWISGKEDPDYVLQHPFKIGDVVEIYAIDPKGAVGPAILVIEKLSDTERYYTAQFVVAAEKTYSDFMLKKDGHPMSGLYRVAVHKGDEQEKKLNNEKVLHIFPYRILLTEQDPICLAPCK